MANTKGARARRNFMIKIELLEQLEQWIPKGARSDFINDALEEKLIDFGREKAMELMDESKTQDKRAYSTEEILTALERDRFH